MEDTHASYGGQREEMLGPREILVRGASTTEANELLKSIHPQLIEE